MTKSLSVSTSPMASTRVIITLCLIIVGIMSATVFVLVERELQRDTDPESPSIPANSCNNTNQPPPPIGHPSPQFCKQMVEYNRLYGLHHHESVPAEIRGDENHVEERICVHGNFTAIGLDDMDHPHDHVDTSNRSQQWSQDKQVSLSTICTLGKFFWSLTQGNAPEIADPPQVSVLPEGVDVFSIMGWKKFVSQRSGWNLESAFFGTGAEYYFTVRADYMGTEDGYAYYLKNIRVESEFTLGHSHSLKVDIRFDEVAEDVARHYKVVGDEVEFSPDGYGWDVETLAEYGYVVAGTTFSINYKGSSAYDDYFASATFWVDGIGGFYVLQSRSDSGLVALKEAISPFPI